MGEMGLAIEKGKRPGGKARCNRLVWQEENTVEMPAMALNP